MRPQLGWVVGEVRDLGRCGSLPLPSHKRTVLKNSARRIWESGKGAGSHFADMNAETYRKVNARGMDVSPCCI